MAEKKLCKAESCDKPAVCKGVCQAHYVRLRKYGTTDESAMHPRHRRIQKWVEINASYAEDDCLIWPFFRGKNGRGVATLDGRHSSAPNIMCTVAHGERPTKRHEAAHSCGNGKGGCVNQKHLRWATKSENEADKLIHGTMTKGEAINTSKLTEGDVREIRRIGTAETRKAIGKMFGITADHVGDILKRNSWAWLI